MGKRNRGYIIAAALGVLGGGAVVALATKAIPISSVLPILPAGKDCMLGYRAHCSFTPVSTLISIVAAAVFCAIRKRKLTVE
jgi:hypothetical protein